MATNYTGVDLDRYNAGNKFYSQDRYLQGIGLDKPAITFNPSNYDTGITSQYGNNSMYGTPTNTGGSGGGINFGNFNQKDNLFEVGPMSGAAPGSFRASQDIGINQTPVGRFDGLKNIAGKVGNYGLKAMSSQMGSQGGAMLGSMIPGGGILSMILGAGAGGKFGFDMSGKGPTDPERITANFYGNQGNSPTQYLDPNTGQLVNSEMQGYNISSARGQGIQGTLEDRLATIDATLAAREEEEKTGIYKGLNKMHKNSLYQKRSRMNKELAAMNQSEQQQMDNMAAQERSVLDDYFGGSGAGADGNRYDGASSAKEYSANPTSFSGSS